jgi:elongation factor P
MKAKDVRKGQVFLHNNVLYRVMDFHHHTPGNLRAMVHIKMRNVLSGTQTEARFGSTEDIELQDVFQNQATFLYADNSGYHFMNQETFEEVNLTEELMDEVKYYLQEGMVVSVSLYNEQPIGIELPQTVVLTIAETEPGLKGATASNSPKPAKTDTGLQLSVPPFVKEGDRVTVDTATGKYLSRAD